MAGDTYQPMGELFQAVSAELDDAMIPMRFGLRYPQILVGALRRLGVNEERRKRLNWDRQVEDVREKMLEKRRFGSFYLGKPHCLAAKKEWFIHQRMTVTDWDSIVMPIASGSMENAMTEALNRFPHMIQKHNTSSERRNRALARGFLIEYTIRDYFKKRWPEFYQEPDNEGRYTEPCDHDFRLLANGYNWKIDVSGRRMNDDKYGNPGKKHPVDWHLLCRRFDETYVAWEGVVSGRRYKDIVDVETTLSPRSFVVYLNCLRDGLPYDELRRQAAL